MYKKQICTLKANLDDDALRWIISPKEDIIFALVL